MSRRSGGGRRGFERGYIRDNGAVKKIRALGENVLAAAKEALKEGADLVVDDAKTRCPVDTGKLRDSIQANAKRGGAAYTISANAETDKGVAYGQFVEFDPRINKPFLYPALYANSAEVHEKIADAIRRATRGR